MHRPIDLFRRKRFSFSAAASAILIVDSGLWVGSSCQMVFMAKTIKPVANTHMSTSLIMNGFVFLRVKVFRIWPCECLSLFWTLSTDLENWEECEFFSVAGGLGLNPHSLHRRFLLKFVTD
jgi:hypothetical protein